MNTEKKRGVQAADETHFFVTGGKPDPNAVLIFLHLCLSVSIRGGMESAQTQ
jgi:hypothetical protein